MSVDLVVVYSSVGGGHKAAALAVAEAAERQRRSVLVLDAFDHAPRWAGDAYLAAHLAGQNMAPELYGLLYAHANRHDPLFDPIRHGIDALLFGELAERVRRAGPRAVIATHHLPLVVLGRARKNRALAAPVLGVVTDYTAHACWAESGVDLWSVPSAAAARELAGHGVPRRRIADIGIPVRAAFARVPSIERSPSVPLRVLVTSGGFGAAALARIVASFAGVPDVFVTVVCGDSPAIEARVREAAAAAGVAARVIGFERDMPARMAEAHLVVGKAGGLTVTEAMTAGRPMIVASAVPGNEKVNERFVVSAGAGASAPPERVGAVVAGLVRAGVLPEMAARARAAIRPGAADRLVALALALGQRQSVTYAESGASS